MSEQQKDAWVIFADALEAACVQLKQNLGAKTQKPLESFDPDKIAWQPRQGQKGPYELSEDFNNPEYKKMLALMQTAGGNLSKGGKFYWTFQNGSTVGRKDRTPKEVKT
jgi:hypothetical protein